MAALVDDITLAALFARLEDNPRGLLLAIDELAGWIRSFNKYRSSGGGDEQAWLSIHNTDPAKIDRKGAAGSPQRIYVPRAAVAVVGTIQPGIAKKYIGSSENLGSGLAARILLAKPPISDARWTNVQTSAKTREHYLKVVHGLLQLQLTENGDPSKLRLSEQAKAMFIQFHDENGAACADAARNGDEDMAAVLSKLRGAAARIALVLALARAAEEGKASDLTEVDADAMSNGIDIARYFESEARRLYAGWRRDAVSEPASAHATLTDKDIEERIIEILRNGEKSRSELSNAFGRNVSSDRIGNVLELLRLLCTVDCRREKSGSRGRPKETWFLCEGGMTS